tara:strand:+ start:555 stop:2045 length:1491 start_codon:yes stop_codon:yes gene_type:complete
MSRIRDIATILSQTEQENPDNLAIVNTGSGAKVTVINSLDSLPITGLSSGQQAYVTSISKLYVSNGSGWYNTAVINQDPNWDSVPLSEYTIADSVTPLIIIAKPTDSDNINLLNQSVASDSAQYMVDITIDSSVFTFIPKSADSVGEAVNAGNLTDSNGDFIYTFKWSDGVNFVTQQATISYSPKPPPTGFTRGLISGGTFGSGGYSNIDMFTLATGGSTTSFGNMNIGRGGHTAFGNASRSLFAGGETGSSANSEVSSVEYVTPSTTGNGASFGNMNANRAWMGSVANLTRGVIGGGADYSPPGGGGSWTDYNRCDYFTFDTLSSSTYFGYMGGYARGTSGAANSGDNTYGIFVGGINPSTSAYESSMQRITIDTTGTASTGFGSFGQTQKAYAAGCASSSHTYFAGGLYPTIDDIEKHSITSGGSATNIGNLSAEKYSLAGTQDEGNYGFFSGGYGYTYYSNIEQINFSSDAIAANFGSGPNRYRLASTSGAGS